MLSASEAKTQTQNNVNYDAAQKLKALDEQISNAIAKGGFSIRNDGILQSEIRKKLESLGYKIETGSQYNESYYRISWA